MFEGSLVASRGLQASGTGRWSALSSITLQCALAAVLLAIPILHPEAVPLIAAPPRLIAPPPPRPPLPPIHVQIAPSTSTAFSAPAPTAAPAPAGSRILFPLPGDLADTPTLTTGLPVQMSGSNPLAALTATAPNRPAISIAHPTAAGPVRISSGVSAGMLLTPIQLSYPPIAKAAGVQGTVVIEATISKTGSIESLTTLSGPPMLRQAAVEAVRAARYQPYKLNGEPTEVQTTITLVFRLGG